MILFTVIFYSKLKNKTKIRNLKKEKRKSSSVRKKADQGRHTYCFDCPVPSSSILSLKNLFAYFPTPKSSLSLFLPCFITTDPIEQQQAYKQASKQAGEFISCQKRKQEKPFFFLLPPFPLSQLSFLSSPFRPYCL